MGPVPSKMIQIPQVNCGCDQGGDGQNGLASGGAEVGWGGGCIMKDNTKVIVTDAKLDILTSVCEKPFVKIGESTKY